MKAQGLALLASVFFFGCSAVPETPLKSDPYWVSAQLDNGMRYHIYPDKEKPVSVRLVMHVGSFQESDIQQGYAHYLEHMAFNGSKNFSHNDVIDLFQQAGASFGADINAYTSYQETVYKLDLPDNSKLASALLWMRDVGDGITLDSTEVSKEADVIMGEFRISRQQEKPTGMQFYEHMIKDTLYEQRDPIGTRESVQNADTDGLRAFYQMWYQPQLAQVIVTGDVTLENAVNLIEDTFSSWQKGETPATAKQHDIALSKQDFAGHTTHGESPSIGIMIPRGLRQWQSREDLFHYWLDDISQQLIYQRLNRDFINAALPGQGTASISYFFERQRYSYSQVTFPEQYRQQSQTQFFTSLASIRDYGVNEGDLAAVMKGYQDNLKNIKWNWEKMDALNHAEGKTLAVSLEQVVQSELDHKSSLEEFIAKVDVDYINRHLKAMLSSEYLLATGVDKQVPLSEIKQQFSAMKHSFSRPGTKPINVMVSDAFAKPNAPGEVISQSLIREEPRLTQWKLSNGIEVIYLNDVEAGDEVNFVYASRGGKESLPVELYPAAEIAVPVVTRSGIGNFSGSELFDHLTKHKTQILPFINFTHHGAEIHTNKDGFAEALAALHVLSTDIKVSPAQLDSVKQEFARNRDAYIQTPFGQFISQVNHNSYTSTSPHWMLAGDGVAKVSADDIHAVHQQLFANNHQYRLVIVGHLSTSQITPLLKQYVASIPLKPAAPVTFDAKYQSQPKPRLDLAINSENSAEYIYRTIAHQPEFKAAKTVFMDDMLRRIIQTRLTRYVREELSLDYAPYSYSAEQDSEPSTDWFIGAKVAPKNIDKIEQAIDHVVANLRAGISEEETRVAAKQLVADLTPLADDKKQYAWFITRYMMHGYGVDALFDLQGTADSISGEDMAQRAKLVFEQENLVTKNILRPAP